VAAAVAEQADVVGGAVEPDLEVEPRYPVMAVDFFKPAQPGKIVESSANLLLSRSVITKLGKKLFDDRFQHTGGSDTELLRRTAAIPAKHAWAKNAVVRELIPESRTTKEWVLQRSYRKGNASVRINIFQNGFLWTVIRSVPIIAVRAAYGAVLMATAGAGSRTDFLGRLALAKTAGMRDALRGIAYQEYASDHYR
jgi:hypothetical protein